jgi:LDH2 family malate/lactate/ureidoglycolate dehydrogenase
MALLPRYLGEIAHGRMATTGEPSVIAENGSVATWDGKRLPGPWLVLRAIDWATARARAHGSATVVIRRSHHIGCLAAYLDRATRQGMLLLITCSDPSAATVAPYGGTRPLFSPNPLAAGIPTSGPPIMVDISASVTTNGMSRRMGKKGQRGEHQWWLDANGVPSTDPSVIDADPPGTILPLGGVDSGHKGYGLALMIEALTAGLAGHGRADPPEGFGATVFIQIYDPEAFSGRAAFVRQTDWTTTACRNNAPRAPQTPVRLPGQKGCLLRQKRLAQGIPVSPAVWPLLEDWAQRLNVAAPEPL